MHDTHQGYVRDSATVVLHVGGLRFATEKAVVERVLSGRPGVISVSANPLAQTATVSFDPGRTSVAELRRWVEACGYHCAGQSVPDHICDPMFEVLPPIARADHPAPAMSPHDAMGHGGGC